MAKKPPSKNKVPTANINNQRISFLIVAVCILFFTFICYYPVIYNGILSWDDSWYIYKNPYIKDISLPTAFATYWMANYHPLTMLLYSWLYTHFEFAPAGYHWVNVLLHMTNTVLVLIFVYKLLDKKIEIAVITSLLFGIYPMHVESVAWIAELKDVLYTFFFFIASIAYVEYAKNLALKSKNAESNYPTKRYLLFAFIAFLLSLFSKGQAVTLPLIFILIDFFIGRKFDKTAILEKIPFFVLSLVFGVIAIKAQENVTAISGAKVTIFESIFYGNYSLLLYILKSFYPFPLSGQHPYPRNPDGSLPFLVYTAPLIVLFLIGLVFWKLRKKKTWTFGILFFIFTIFPLLKFIPVSDSIISERYSYIPYTGLFLCFGYLFEELKKKYSRKIVLVIYSIFILFMGYTTWKRTQVWKDDFSFWSDVINTYPNYWRARAVLGDIYNRAGKYEKAVEEYTKALASDSTLYEVYLNRSVIYINSLNKYDEAMADCKKLLQVKPDYYEAHFNIGVIYKIKNQHAEAVKSFSEAIKSNPRSSQAYYQRGISLLALQKPEAAVNDFNEAVRLDPNYEDAYLERGITYAHHLNQPDRGTNDFSKVLQLNPQHLDAKLNSGLVYYKNGRYDDVIKICDEALIQDSSYAKIYYLRSLTYGEKKDYKKALKDALQAKKGGIQMDENLINLWSAKQ